MEYFTSEKISEHITKIRDICGTFIYLVTGEEKAVLLDTGDGFGNLRTYVNELTSLPVTVVLTHGHLDHIGGCYDFSGSPVYMNPADLELFEKHARIPFRQEFYQMNPAVKDLPAEVYTLPYSGDIIPMNDGDVFDCGGVHIKMISVPGHTQGMMCALIEEDRTVLFGDACGVFVGLLDECSSTVSAYRQSLMKLREYENSYDHIIRNHGTGVSGMELLDNVIECCDLIMNGRDDAVPAKWNGIDCFLAKEMNGYSRADGKEGNIAYSKERIF